ncbi:UbiA family prenyltransferase [Faecalicatena contorta]|uniref:1,4-dihydroxy-2-naphthoate octaprenyltransferase n=1 Tax=Faecalicatena contorta TaxID=39482 RepID=A0A316A352_9FIRM|nr:UbiA family prenyltransferase [Faecalicatena contorta]PWJ52376.1 1,4-dihydroxy-2-naphthoate octaprenyltransferase [Faecalicatena contorta]SUQ12654.1 1,4-dihydroxy-2-naphthoate octaprenyltransferase [Faecalicatena contorta]
MLAKFFDYTEIKTKITSTFTFLLTIGFLLYQRQEIYWGKTLVFFAGMFFFDLTTTAINNYIDSKDNGQVLAFGRKQALLIIYVLFGISTAAGLYLAYLTDLVVLVTGGICFLFGVFYTYGPLPISRMPLGEVISGFFYGVIIPFILMYINSPKGTFLTYGLSWETVSLSVHVIPLLTLILFSITPFAVTANIMLANNICDLEKDIAVKRHTLPYYIGKKALLLFAGLYYLTYISMILMVIFGVLPPVALLSLFTIILVQKNIRAFWKKQEKSTTFNLSIINFILIMGGNTLAIFLAVILDRI